MFLYVYIYIFIYIFIYIHIYIYMLCLYMMFIYIYIIYILYIYFFLPSNCFFPVIHMDDSMDIPIFTNAFLALAVGQEDASTPSLKVTVDAGSILSNWGRWRWRRWRKPRPMAASGVSESLPAVIPCIEMVNMLVYY